MSYKKLFFISTRHTSLLKGNNRKKNIWNERYKTLISVVVFLERWNGVFSHGHFTAFHTLLLSSRSLLLSRAWLILNTIQSNRALYSDLAIESLTVPAWKQDALLLHHIVVSNMGWFSVFDERNQYSYYTKCHHLCSLCHLYFHKQRKIVFFHISDGPYICGGQLLNSGWNKTPPKKSFRFIIITSGGTKGSSLTLGISRRY